MTWPGLYWSKVHFNNRLWTQYPAWETDYDALLRQFVEVVLIGLVLAVDIFISEDCLMRGSCTYTHFSRYKLIHINFNWCSPCKQSRQQRDVTSNQWDSRSGLFISVSSNSRQWNPCQVPGCEVIKGTYRWMGCLRHRQTTSQYPRQCLQLTAYSSSFELETG